MELVDMEAMEAQAWQRFRMEIASLFQAAEALQRTGQRAFFVVATRWLQEAEVLAQIALAAPLLPPPRTKAEAHAMVVIANNMMASVAYAKALLQPPYANLLQEEAAIRQSIDAQIAMLDIEVQRRELAPAAAPAPVPVPVQPRLGRILPPLRPLGGRRKSRRQRKKTRRNK